MVKHMWRRCGNFQKRIIFGNDKQTATVLAAMVILVCCFAMEENMANCGQRVDESNSLQERASGGGAYWSIGKSK